MAYSANKDSHSNEIHTTYSLLIESNDFVYRIKSSWLLFSPSRYIRCPTNCAKESTQVIRFCPSVTSFVVYARRCEKCCLFRVCDYIFKRCIDCGVPEPRTETRIAGGGGIVLRNTAMRTSIRGRHSLMTTVVSLFEKEREREVSSKINESNIHCQYWRARLPAISAC